MAIARKKLITPAAPVSRRARAKLANPVGSYFAAGRDKENMEFSSTGCALVDEALGGGPVLGRVINIVGDKSTGKTGLAMVLIEEVLRHGVPALLIDPKGDLTNIALQFPDLAAADYLPWVDTQEAAKAGQTPQQAAEATATSWREGLAGWELSGEDIRAFKDKTRFTIYTGTPVVPPGRNGLIPPPRSLTPERDPLFYRLDLRIEKRWNLTKTAWLSFVAEVLNATLHTEVLQGQTIGPVTIPSIGVEGAF